MNFKRFHESKNLFDGSIEQGSLNESSGIGADYNNTKTIPTATVNPYRIRTTNPIYIDRELTLSVDFNSYQMYVLFYDENQQYTGEHSSSWRNSSLTLSGEYIGKYIGLALKNKAGSNVPISPTDDIKLMLNTGSQPLPYEPYSSEVWHSIPHYIHNTSTDTLTTLPAVIYANNTTATVGLKGQMVQSGTPTPTTPIQPQECGEVTVNLFGGTMEVGTITDRGNPNTSTTRIRTVDFMELEAGTYTLNATANSSLETYVFIYDLNNTFIERIPTLWASVPYTFTIANKSKIKFLLAFAPAAGGTAIVTSDVSNIMLNLGSEPLPYEPYGQYKIPILNNSQTTNVYLGEVETTRRIKKLVLTGSEAWQRQTTSHTTCINLYCPVSDALSDSMIVSNIVVYAPVVGGANDENVNVAKINAAGTNLLIDMALSDFADITAWVTYLQQQYAAGTPVCVWYVLATETTGIVNEPLRKIGDYADEVSGITIPTIAGANTLSVDTTLQPSEVTATYKGWHPVQSVHERESGQWD